MIHSIETIKAKSVPLSITRVALKQAEEFARLQPSADKQHQVYYNTLAVCVVNEYMRMMGIETNLEASDSWNSVLRLAADIADLVLPGLGHLECRFVTPASHSITALICYIPAEVPQDRIGVVVVALEPEEQQATLLGFSKIVETTALAIDQLQTIDDLLDYLAELRTVKTPSLVQLSQWLEQQFEAGWQSLESLLNPPTIELGWSFRAPETIVERAKSIDLGRQLMAQSVLLVVRVTPTTTAKIKFVVTVQPSNGQTNLPAELQLAMLDEAGASKMVAGGNSANKSMQLLFDGERGDKFNIKLTLGDVSVVEHFVI